ncbi:ethanolamine ammonia-lyase [Serratia ureilytica]|nr:ethanolamine ammonia-lyase [Serratia ureilytica]MBH2945594.1 ethanolamine ammonia-lyase [Serratia ureilytica]
MYQATLGQRGYRFGGLRQLMAKASPARSGDYLAEVAAESAEERMAARIALADVPLKTFLQQPLVPYEQDEVTRLIIDSHDAAAFEPISHLTIGDFRDWLLSEQADSAMLAQVAAGIMPEMAAAVSKIMRNQDLILVAKKCRVVTRFRNTIGLPGHLSVRLQPNHPTDSLQGIAASMLDGLLYGSGDAVVGINPASDSLPLLEKLNYMLDDVIQRFAIPTQSCVLTHVTNTLRLMERGAPVDLVFQSIAGTEAANRGFGISLALLAEAQQAALSLKRGTLGDNVMYFETGQGSCLSANAHHGVDQQTCEARAYAVARHFSPLLINTVVGFIGPEYLYDGKQIIRAGLEDHFCGKLLGLPLGCDVCYTNHAEADQDDMDTLLTLLAAAGLTFLIGVPGADDIMLNYQSTSFHDALYIRELLGLKHAPEFAAWLAAMNITDERGRLRDAAANHPLLLALRPYLDTLGLAIAPVVLAHQARVALGDEIGECLQARAVAVLIGERPGLSSPDSLGIYLTWEPNARRRDSERNCISNVRPEGLDYPQAAFRLAWLLEQACRRGLTGVELKDESDNPALRGRVTPLYAQLGG